MQKVDSLIKVRSLKIKEEIKLWQKVIEGVNGWIKRKERRRLVGHMQNYRKCGEWQIERIN